MDTSSSGILVLGMHRSGTSALARILNLGGADVGARILGASKGNEVGHWEDALAVELHERLLASFATQWDEPYSIPAGWEHSEAAQDAKRQIRGYLASNRSRQSLWAVKDPRLSLFAGLWSEAALELGIPLGAAVVLRHPLEVAHSLAARDGIPQGKAMLLWLEYTLAAVKNAERVPSFVLTYDRLLSDWRGCIALLARLPGGERLGYDQSVALEVDRFLDRGLRHHAGNDLAQVPTVVADLWEMLSGLPADGGLPAGTAARISDASGAVRELLHPVLDDIRVERRALWVRVANAEAPVVQAAAALPVALEEVRSRLDSHHRDVIRAFSDDIQAMQQVTALALQRTAAAEEKYSEKIIAVAELERDRKEQLHEIQVLSHKMEDRQRELAALRQDVSQLRDASAQLALVKSSMSWRLTRPFRVFFRLLMGRVTTSDGSRLRTSARSVLAAMPLLPESVRSHLIQQTMKGGVQPADVPAAMAPLLGLSQAQDLPDVFVWAVIDWHFRTQRPQHLARALAEKGHRVFYISNNFLDSPEPGFSVDRLGDDGRLFQIHLHQEFSPAIYHGMPDALQIERMRASLARLLGWTGTRSSVSIVQHPYWSKLVRAVPNVRVVYDCMDHHGGFENNATAILEAEKTLISDADLVIVSSSWLEASVGPETRAIATIRNAAEYALFCTPPQEIFQDPTGRRIIGYYGAIAEWFDLDLLRAVAVGNPGALIMLVGSDTAGAAEVLADLPNVGFSGEVSYASLPYYLHGFDVCLLPFKVIPLTLATNPVKVYEYLAAGKPVVAVDLPEMTQFRGLVEIATDYRAFVSLVTEVLTSRADPLQARARQVFAAEQTWDHRAQSLDTALASIKEPQISVVVLTYNNLEYTKACLQSLEAHSDYANLEIIVVDNASSDGSPEWLQSWESDNSAAGHQRRLVLNPVNSGFSAGNNIGLRASRGEYLVVLNNDTYVTPGWVRTLCAHLRTDASLGLVGPTTNNIGNEARIEIQYADMEEMIQKAGEHTRANPGLVKRMRSAAFFCVAMSRRTYERVGDMDEDFGVGFFEDDDYCRRVELAGLEIACAEDVFVHHHLSASFDKLGAERKRELFEQNKAIYEKKWGRWEPHVYRLRGEPASSAG